MSQKIRKSNHCDKIQTLILAEYEVPEYEIVFSTYYFGGGVWGLLQNRFRDGYEFELYYYSLVQCRPSMNASVNEFMNLILFSSRFYEKPRFFEMAMKWKNIAATEARLYPLKSYDSQLFNEYNLVHVATMFPTSWSSQKIVALNKIVTKIKNSQNLFTGTFIHVRHWTSELCYEKSHFFISFWRLNLIQLSTYFKHTIFGTF